MATENIHSYKRLLKSIKVLGIISLIMSWGFVIPNSWPVGLVFTTLTIAVLIFADSYLKKLERGYAYHLSLCLLSIPYVLLLIFASGFLLQRNSSPKDVFLLLLFLIVLGFWIATNSYRKEFGATMLKNIKTGRLDADQGVWNLAAPLVMYDNEEKNEIKYYTGMRRLISPFFIAIAFYLARNLDGNAEVLLRSFSLLFIGASFFWSSAYQLAIAFVLLDWEKRIGKEIMVVI